MRPRHFNLICVLSYSGLFAVACTKTDAPIASPALAAPADPQSPEATSTKSPLENPTAPAANSDVAPVPSESQEVLKAPVAVDKSLDCGGDDLFGPSHTRQQVFDSRYGAGAAKFSQVPTTSSSPIEACGLDAALFTLSDLRCDAGERPYKDRREAHASRRGSIGPGGRCDAIIDVYEVPCPEKTYAVHVDMYFCGPKGT